MRYIIIFSGFILSLCSCGQRNELIKKNWIIIDGKFNGQPIEFLSTDGLNLTDKNGKVVQRLNFLEDETIVLPGINSPDISANWKIVDNKILLSIDSSEYLIYNPDTDTSEPYLGGHSNFTPRVVFESTKDFVDAIKVYEQPFDYYISSDTLRLQSNDVIIRAIRDKTIDDLFKNL